MINSKAAAKCSKARGWKEKKKGGKKSPQLFGGHWIHTNPLERRDRITYSPFWKLKTAESSEKKIRNFGVGEGTDTRGMLNRVLISNGRTKCNSAVISVTNEIAATIRKQSSRHLENILIWNTIKVQQSFQGWEVVGRKGTDNTKYLRKF